MKSRECKDQKGPICTELINANVCQNRKGMVECSAKKGTTGFISEEDYQAAEIRLLIKQKAASSAGIQSKRTTESFAANFDASWEPRRTAAAASAASAASAEDQSSVEHESGENYSDSFVANPSIPPKPQRRRTDQSASLSGKAQSLATQQAPSTTNSISIFISGHGSEDKNNMFFQDTNPEFITLKNEYSYIGDVIHNVNMISTVGRWGGAGICKLPLNQSEMTISQDFFFNNTGSKPYEIMQGLSQTLPQLLREHIKEITDSSVTVRSTIIQYIKKHRDDSYYKIIDLLNSLLQKKKELS